MIPLRDQDLIRQKLAAEMIGPVKVDYFTQRELVIDVPGRAPCAYCKPTREMLQELAALSDTVSLRVHVFEENPPERAQFGIERIPAIVLRPGGPAPQDGPLFVKYYGMPGGTEFPAFLETIIDLSRLEVLLSPESVKALSALKEDVSIRVFVTPTCPYCPQMMRLAYQMALVSPRVHAEAIEASEFPELSERFQVTAVPLTVINDRIAIPGAVHEQQMVEQVVKAAAGKQPSETPEGPATPAAPAEAPPAKKPVERGKRRDSGLYIP